MRTLLLTIVLASGLMGAAHAADRDAAIEAVIQSQIDAFLAEDVATAFSFASPTIKRLFGTPETFGRMVREGYPMVWRPAEVSYLDQEARGGAVLQRVLITDGAGVPHVLEYQMIPTPDGWQINGVQILRAPALGA